MRSLFVIIVLMLTAHVFARKPAQNLQDSLRVDSLHVDSLSKISLTADIDANNVVDTRITNKHFLFGVFVQLGIFGNHK